MTGSERQTETTVNEKAGTAGSVARPRLELAVLLALTALINLFDLGRNGWSNTYYSATVRSMTTSWHNFIYASFDPAGVMTVDKPPLALWAQAASAKVLGFNAWGLLIPQALMGVASVALLYDLTRRVWGRRSGLVAGAALALTPITVALSRHNNPDALLALCSVAALWAIVRALQDGRTRWLIVSGVAIGLGFETKMGAALMVLPALAAAYMYVAPRGYLTSFRQLLAGGAALVTTGLAWPVLMWLTPAADRPWISGTSDNNIFSLILGYNGLGRVNGQSGGPGGLAGGAGGVAGSSGGAAAPGGFAGGPAASGGIAGGAAPPGAAVAPGATPGGGTGGFFGGDAGPWRLFNEGMGGQAGWLLAFAVAAAIGVVVVTRLRREDKRTGWLIATGGSLLTIAYVFSTAKGIFHPYYVAQLAPFTAALVGAGYGLMRESEREPWLRWAAAGALIVCVYAQFQIKENYAGTLSWLPVLLVGVVLPAAIAIALLPDERRRRIAIAIGLGGLMLAPAVWSLQTLSHAVGGTFPSGGPAGVASTMGGPGARKARRALASNAFGRPRDMNAFSASPDGNRPGMRPGASGAGMPPGDDTAGMPGMQPGGNIAGMPPGGPAVGSSPNGIDPSSGASASSPGLPGTTTGRVGGGPFGGLDLSGIISYTKKHGGGTIAVSGQQGASTAIIEQGASVAGIGGFSGRESEVSVDWLADRVARGKIRWIYTGGGTGGMRNDGRIGSKTALNAVQSACGKIDSSKYASGSAKDTAAIGSRAATGAAFGGRFAAGTFGGPLARASAGSQGSSTTASLYDCKGRASRLRAAD